VQGVEETAERNGFSVFLSSSYRDAERELAMVRSFHERRANGIIVTGSQLDERYLELGDQLALPIVLINCRTYPYSVYADNLSGARQAVAYLVELGHRRIAYVTGQGSHQSNLDRLAGYQQVLTENDLRLEDSLIFSGEGTLACGVRAARRLQTMPQPPTAIFCFNDLTAIGVIRGLQQSGALVPHDYSVVGFDDLELASYYCPALTTVRQPTQRLGQSAIDMLLDLIHGDRNQQPERLPADLVVRDSTGPAPNGA
jgi:DNA-binding LacI/PurR family transcriptional regulator